MPTAHGSSVVCLFLRRPFLAAASDLVQDSFAGPVPDSKTNEAYIGLAWGRQGPGGPHVDPMNLVIRGAIVSNVLIDCPHASESTLGDMVKFGRYQTPEKLNNAHNFGDIKV